MNEDREPLAGRVALVTGAARGIGRNVALRLAAMGADVIALDAWEPREVPAPDGPEADLAVTAAAIAASGRRVFTANADVRRLDVLTSAIDAGVARLGRLDIVCANAGIHSTGAAHELSEEAWMRMIDINLNGVWRTTRAATPHLLAHDGGGSIVLMSSAAAFAGYANLAHYVTAKTGVVGLMRALAVELAPHRIRVNSVHPTSVRTDMLQGDELVRMFLPAVDRPTDAQFADAMTTRHPMGVPWVEPEDVSAAVAFLVSDEARYVTGTQLPVMAGRACP